MAKKKAAKASKSGKNGKIIEALQKAYWMEIETVQNYIANSINLDGVRAEEIKKSLQMDVNEELTHAQSLGHRIKELGGRTPSSLQFKPIQKTLQTPKNTTDVVAVIKGVIDAESSAIAHYKNTIRLCEGTDYVTQDLCVRLLADEESHLSLFKGFLLEYSK